MSSFDQMVIDGKLDSGCVGFVNLVLQYKNNNKRGMIYGLGIDCCVLG